MVSEQNFKMAIHFYCIGYCDDAYVYQIRKKVLQTMSSVDNLIPFLLYGDVLEISLISVFYNIFPLSGSQEMLFLIMIPIVG